MISSGASPAQNIMITVPVTTPNHRCHKNDMVSVVKALDIAAIRQKSSCYSPTAEAFPKTVQQSYVRHKHGVDLPPQALCHS